MDAVSGRKSAAAEADAIHHQLRTAATPQRAASEKAYLKLDLAFTGTTVPQIRAIVLGWRQSQPGLERGHLLAVATELWSRPVFECRLAAVILLADRRQLLRAEDMALVERLLRESRTWALVDSLAADVAGSLAERFPELGSTLDRWSADDDFWIRRAAMLALLVPLRRGDLANFRKFAGYADRMLAEKEFFIRKAIGWILRETGKRHPEVVSDWLRPRAQRASGVTIREAVKYLPPADRDQLLAAHWARRQPQP